MVALESDLLAAWIDASPADEECRLFHDLHPLLHRRYAARGRRDIGGFPGPSWRWSATQLLDWFRRRRSLRSVRSRRQVERVGDFPVDVRPLEPVAVVEVDCSVQLDHDVAGFGRPEVDSDEVGSDRPRGGDRKRARLRTGRSCTQPAAQGDVRAPLPVGPPAPRLRRPGRLPRSGAGRPRPAAPAPGRRAAAPEPAAVLHLRQAVRELGRRPAAKDVAPQLP